MPTGNLAKWKILLNEFDIVYITEKAIKGQALADHSVENTADGDYEPLNTYFLDEEVLFAGDDTAESYLGWGMFFDGVANFKGVEIGAHPEKKYIDPIKVEIRDQHAYCLHVDEEPYGKPRYHDVRRFLATREYPENSTNSQKRALKRLANHFFLNGDVLYRRTPDLGLLRCVDAAEVTRQWHEKLSFALLGYRTTMRTFTGTTPYMLVYGTEALILAKVEIPSLRVIQEAKLDDAEWIQIKQEKLMLIDEKRIDAVCHGQLYQNRMANAFNKRVMSRLFIPGHLVLKKIFPHQEEAKGKFTPDWQGPYVVHPVLLGESLILVEMDVQFLSRSTGYIKFKGDEYFF
ncbi:uncharacterized protein [Nicotiana tomentosiformis]|uniref:uncharacterized protein n=1 Tax=Nicotiana tomentosiformis TaxID=4098 RepID=UPI00388C4FA0